MPALFLWIKEVCKLPLNIKPCHLRAARDYVSRYHRHSIPPVGGKFAVACYDGDRLCGIAICGRPVARYLDDGLTLEILRCCTDGTYNACSKLYGACCHIGFDMGITKTGKRYHYSNSCNGGTYYASTLEEALRQGLTPCQKCVE